MREQPHLLEQNAQSPGGGDGRESSGGRESWGFVATLHRQELLDKMGRKERWKLEWESCYGEETTPGPKAGGYPG